MDEIEISLNKLLNTKELVFAKYQFNASKLNNIVLESEESINKSIKFSKKLALKFKDKKLDELLKEYNLSVVNGNCFKDNYTLSYFKSPNKIIINEENINRVYKKINHYGIKLEKDKIKDVSIAYALFFYLIKSMNRITIDDVSFKKEVLKDKNLTEIVAKTFAKELTNLCFSVYVLDFILYTSIDDAKAKAMMLSIFELDLETIDTENM